MGEKGVAQSWRARNCTQPTNGLTSSAEVMYLARELYPSSVGRWGKKGCKLLVTDGNVAGGAKN